MNKSHPAVEACVCPCGHKSECLLCDADRHMTEADKHIFKSLDKSTPSMDHEHRQYGIVSNTAFKCFGCKMISVNGKWYAEQEAYSG